MDGSIALHQRALKRAAEILGGNDQLRAYLRVPRPQLLLWMEGVEKLPLDHFLRIVDLILSHSPPGAGTQRIRVGPNTARCPACDQIDFRLLDPGAVMSSTSVLVCIHCKHEVTRGSLVVAAADEGAQRAAACVSRASKKAKAESPPALDSADSNTKPKD